MHLAREISVSASSYPQKFIAQDKKSFSRRVTITTNPEVVEFDPALPPAACSVLPVSQFIDRTTIQQGLDGKAARELHDPPYVDWGTSNCGLNQTYNDNMVAMAAADENGFDLTDNLSVSDTDYGPADDQITLGLKVSPCMCPCLDAEDAECA